MLDQDAQDRLTAAVEETGRHLGLYAHAIRIHQPDPDEDPSIPDDHPAIVLASFDVGDLAFSSRVLDPQNEETNAEFREMVVDEQRSEVERLRREGMTGALAELEDDDGADL
jgi:hypothetical protein